MATATEQEPIEEPSIFIPTQEEVSAEDDQLNQALDQIVIDHLDEAEGE